jgi:hypothetical protein
MNRLADSGNSQVYNPPPPSWTEVMLRLAPQHDDFGRFLVLTIGRGEPTPAEPPSATVWRRVH